MRGKKEEGAARRLLKSSELGGLSKAGLWDGENYQEVTVQGSVIGWEERRRSQGDEWQDFWPG